VENAKHVSKGNFTKVDAKTTKIEFVHPAELVRKGSIKWAGALALMTPFANPVQNVRQAIKLV
jgi:hypothetical protein